MQIECGSMHSPALYQSGFSKASKSFDPIYMTGRCNKFITSMIDSKMFGIAQIYQSVIGSPSIRVNDAIDAYFTLNNPLKALFRGIWDNFCIHVSIAFKNSEDDCFTSGTTASFAFGPTPTEVGFIAFKYLFTELRLRWVNSAICAAVKSRQNNFKSCLNLASEIRER